MNHIDSTIEEDLQNSLTGNLPDTSKTWAVSLGKGAKQCLIAVSDCSLHFWLIIQEAASKAASGTKTRRICSCWGMLDNLYFPFAVHFLMHYLVRNHSRALEQKAPINLDEIGSSEGRLSLCCVSVSSSKIIKSNGLRKGSPASSPPFTLVRCVKSN